MLEFDPLCFSISPDSLMHPQILTYASEHFYGEDAAESELDAVIMEHTGLYDMNGVEIYEGDVLRYVHPYEPDYGQQEIYQVEWKGFGFEARWLNPYFDRCTSDGRLALVGADKEMVIIGNIYENPELLK